MKTTVTIDADLLERAKESLGINDAERVVEFALRDALHGKASERMAALGETKSLFSRGFGYIDTHLIAAASANPPVKILTREGRFHRAAVELGIAA